MITVAHDVRTCHAGISKNHFYVENIEEELDDTREWFAKVPQDDGSGQASAVTLMYIPANGIDLNDPATSIIGASLPTVLYIDGASYLTFRGITITHTAPTYMAPKPYECPSGGDWAIHRSAAVFVTSFVLQVP